MCVCMYIGCLLGFKCENLLSFAIPFSSPPRCTPFLGCMRPKMTFKACPVTAYFTTDWALTVALALMNVMQSSKLDTFSHMAIKTSIVQQDSSLGSCSTFPSPNPHYNRPSGHLTLRLMEGRDKQRLLRPSK